MNAAIPKIIIDGSGIASAPEADIPREAKIHETGFERKLCDSHSSIAQGKAATPTHARLALIFPRSSPGKERSCPLVIYYAR
ncbi:hypothetical protein SAMN05216387_11813 [Nitrosovibrio tenuis]|uniref:Uncharacterized protein n=1 Tax=Nitrosovibrio tenuis TaxID=1233 RepID=A0A1H7RP06_9PROT|nr:hypothetical protein SAMN05216387_11813 [Nitrosovibrio tenuis]